MQAGIDYCSGEFAALVGRQGRMSAKAAADTQTAIYHDREATRDGAFDQRELRLFKIDKKIRNEAGLS